MDYKEKILDEFEKSEAYVVLPSGHRAFTLDDIEQNLATLPSEEEIAKGMIEEYREELKSSGKTMAQSMNSINRLKMWLDKEGKVCMGCIEKGCNCGGYEENRREGADGHTFGDS